MFLQVPKNGVRTFHFLIYFIIRLSNDNMELTLWVFMEAENYNGRGMVRGDNPKKELGTANAEQTYFAIRGGKAKRVDAVSVVEAAS
ncbi:hypothetical protein DPMN_019107, partial [Dreissena polymorpha]